jgi:hypothetical protein
VRITFVGRRVQKRKFVSRRLPVCSASLNSTDETVHYMTWQYYWHIYTPYFYTEHISRVYQKLFNCQCRKRQNFNFNHIGSWSQTIHSVNHFSRRCVILINETIASVLILNVFLNNQYPRTNEYISTIDLETTTCCCSGSQVKSKKKTREKVRSKKFIIIAPKRNFLNALDYRI